MQKTYLQLTIGLLFIASYLSAQAPLSLIYGSGPYSGNTGTAYDVLVYSDAAEELITWEAGNLSYQPMQEWYPPSWLSGTVSGSAPYPYIGFKSEDPTARINPVYWNATTTPPLDFFVEAVTDPVGDHLFTNNALDLLSMSVSLSDDKLHFALRNSSGAYPTSSGVLTYYAYMAVLVNPDADPGSNPIVYGLMYTVNISGVIEPGLYKITGTGLSDQTLIGQLTTSIVNNTLMLSCNFSDLTADPDFSSWFDPANPRISAAAMASRITLTSGVQEADATSSFELFCKAQPLPTQNDNQPVLSAVRVDSGWVSDVFYIQGYVDYTDADNNFPRWASFSLDGAEPQALHILSPFPMSFDQGPVHHVTEMIPATPDWNEARFRFAHGDSYVEEVVINEVASSDPNIPSAPLKLYSYPNPVSKSLSMEVSGAELYEISLFNLKGQRLLSLYSDISRHQLDLSAYAPGIYILRIDSARGSLSRKILKTR